MENIDAVTKRAKPVSQATPVAAATLALPASAGFSSALVMAGVAWSSRYCM